MPQAEVPPGQLVVRFAVKPCMENNPVVVSFDVYGKDSIHVAAAMPAGGAFTLGQYAASRYAAWEAPDPARGAELRNVRFLRFGNPQHT